jgi:hypothetical protein
MNPPDALLKGLPSLSTAESYFCFVRSWWDGAGVDAVAWWSDSSGFFQRLIKTGETTTPKSPSFEEVVAIEPSDLQKLLYEVEELGLLSLPQQTERIIYSHCDDWYGLKRGSAEIAHWLQVRGGKHADSKALLLLTKVFQLAPQMLPDSPPQAPRG